MEMENLLQKRKCSIFHNNFKYMIFQRRQKSFIWSKGWSEFLLLCVTLCFSLLMYLSYGAIGWSGWGIFWLYSLRYEQKVRYSIISLGHPSICLSVCASVSQFNWDVNPSDIFYGACSYLTQSLPMVCRSQWRVLIANMTVGSKLKVSFILNLFNGL